MAVTTVHSSSFKEGLSIQKQEVHYCNSYSLANEKITSARQAAVAHTS